VLGNPGPVPAQSEQLTEIASLLHGCTNGRRFGYHGGRKT
jgi:hypothetical protein